MKTIADGVAGRALSGREPVMGNRIPNVVHDRHIHFARPLRRRLRSGHDLLLHGAVAGGVGTGLALAGDFSVAAAGIVAVAPAAVPGEGKCGDKPGGNRGAG
jgi:hypothetical protein